MKDSVVCQLAPLGADLYNGAPGDCVFLAAHEKLAGDEAAARLSLAGVSALRHDLRGVNPARLARALGIGGSTGLGSVVYAFTVLAELLNNSDLLADAKNAAALFTSDLIAADKSFDVMEGSAGAILSLLRLYRVTRDRDVLHRAAKCGDHLLSQRRSGPGGEKAWLGWGVGRQLNGTSHGAAGFAYALTSLAAATRSHRSIIPHLGQYPDVLFGPDTYGSFRLIEMQNLPDRYTIAYPDLVETFNYLLGLRMKHIDRIRGIVTVQGSNPRREKVLVIWRNIDETSNSKLDEFFQKQGYNTKDMEFDLIYVNGDNNLENLKKDEE